MTKDEIIIALVRDEIDQEQSGIYKLADDLFDLAVGFGTDFIWHGKFKAGSYFYTFTTVEEIVEKYDWNMYGARKSVIEEKRDTGVIEYVCLAYLHE